MRWNDDRQKAVDKEQKIVGTGRDLSKKTVDTIHCVLKNKREKERKSCDFTSHFPCRIRC